MRTNLPPAAVRVQPPRWSSRALVAAFAALVLAGAVGAFPEPAAVPHRWELRFTPGHFRLYTDPIDGASYWYFTYTVTNLTGRDQIWAPSFILYTDTGEILHSGRDVPTRAEESIRDLLGIPLLETQNEVIGDIFQGRENERDALAVWPARMTNVNEVSMFIGGLSGETAGVAHPVTGEQMILRKTLQREYLIRGNALARGSTPIELIEEHWIFR